MPEGTKSSSSSRIVSIFNANWVGLKTLRIALRKLDSKMHQPNVSPLVSTKPAQGETRGVA